MRFFKDVKKYLPYSIYAAKSALRAEVAGSYLNWLWWIFNPICMMFIYTFIFGIVFKASEEYFPVFVFIGLTLWDYFSRTITSSVSLVKAKKSIITKIYLPKFVLLFSEIFVNLFKMLISFGVIVVMLFVLRVPVSLNVIWIIPIIIVETILIFGLSCFIMHFGVFVEDLKNIVKIIMRFIFYGTGIFWNVETRMAEYPIVEKVLTHWNPLGYILVNGRKALIAQTRPELLWLLFWFAAGIALSFFGVMLIYRSENSYTKVI